MRAKIQKTTTSHLILVLCITMCLCSAEAGEFARKENDSQQTTEDWIRQLIAGFSLGKNARILPYVSLDDWFDPYGGLKLGHSLPWSKSDKAFHHFKIESTDDYSWKFKYLIKSHSFKNTYLGFLFKVKFDRDAFFYGIGNSTVKADRQQATYSSHFFGIEITQHLFDKFVYRWSPGLWNFKSGLLDGGNFEETPKAFYFTSRFALSDLRGLDYRSEKVSSYWSTYFELGFPVEHEIDGYARFNFQTETRVPVFEQTKIGIGTRIEYLISPERNNVPYFALPEAGSRSGLRGYSKERFHDYGLISLNFEYAIPVSRRFEFFLLFDAAMTSSTLNLFSQDRIHHNYGLGWRFINKNKPLSVGLATGPEGLKLFSAIAISMAW